VTGRANRVRAGVTFTSLDENSQRTLERFLREKAPGVNWSIAPATAPRSGARWRLGVGCWELTTTNG